MLTREECCEFLRQHDDYLILTHIRPDGDTLGGAAALCHGLRRLGKRAWLFPNREITRTYEAMITPYYAPGDYAGQTVVAVDVAAAHMLCRGFEGTVHLSLDHHPHGGAFSEQCLVDPSKAAGGELILEILDELLGGIDREEADLLYVAVSTDSGCFRFANTTADTFRAAARLTDAGARIAELNKLLFRSKSRARMLLEGAICSSLLSYRNAEINIAVVTLEMMAHAGAEEDDCQDMADLAGMVIGNKVAVTVRELRPGHCKISLRTDGSVDAIAVCRRFGGGGHRMAAGCEIDLPPFEAAEAVRQVVEEYWP